MDQVEITWVNYLAQFLAHNKTREKFSFNLLRCGNLAGRKLLFGGGGVVFCKP